MGSPDLSSRPDLAGARTPLEGATDRLAMGLLVVDSALRVLGANTWAQTLLGAGDPFKETLRGVVARTTNETVALRNAVACCGDEILPLRFSRVAPHSPIDVVIARLDPQSVLVLVRDPESEHDIAAPVLSRLYGLTAAEAELARELVHGHSIESAAAVRGISVQTARTHLKRIFLKTETNRQGQLIAELLAGPAALLRTPPAALSTVSQSLTSLSRIPQMGDDS